MPLAPCGTDHTTLTDKQLRGHYAKGCRDELVRKAATDYARAAAARKKASGGVGGSTAHATAGIRVEAQSAAGQSGMGATIRTPEPAPEPPTKPTPPEPRTLERVGANGPGKYYPALKEPDSIDKLANDLAAFRPTTVPITRQIGTTPAQGASRRLRGLVAFGYTPKQLAEACGLTADSIWWMLIAPPFTIQTASHARIAEVFKRLRNAPRTTTSDTPEGRSTARAHALAKQHDWAGAYSWDDIDFGTKPTHHTRPNVDDAALARAIDNAVIEPATDVPETHDQQNTELQRANDALAETRRMLAGHAATIDRQRAEIQRLTAQLADVVDPQPIQRELTAALTELSATRKEVEVVRSWRMPEHQGRHVDSTRLVDAVAR